jgi:hypothetical protein
MRFGLGGKRGIGFLGAPLGVDFWRGASWPVMEIPPSEPLAADWVKGVLRLRHAPRYRGVRVSAQDDRVVVRMTGWWWLLVDSAYGLGLGFVGAAAYGVAGED